MADDIRTGKIANTVRLRPANIPPKQTSASIPI